MNAALFRYKIYRLAKRIALGGIAGRALGSNCCRSLQEGRASRDVESHVADSRMVAPATVLAYPFPDSFPPEFPRDAAFDAKFVYRLRDVVVSPASGLVWFAGGPILQESAGSLPRLFNGRVADVLRKPAPCPERGPLVLCPPIGYYHVLFDVLPNVLHALSFVPDAKVLLPPNRPGYVDGILAFVGIGKDRLIEASNPVSVTDLVFSPTWVNGGFVPPADLEILRRAILPKTGVSDRHPERIYISRSRSRNRPLANETEIENVLRENGFSVRFFEELPFGEQMSLVRSAKTIVAPHGAGLANLLAASPGTTVVEFLSRRWFNTCYAKLSVQLGLDYRFVEQRTGPSVGKPGAGLFVPPTDILATLDTILP